MINKTQLSFSILTIAALFLLPLVAYAGPSSPFVGHWQAVDVDGSDIRLTIAGPPNGPFQITWKDSYISFCNGEPGIVRGTGLLNESDANLLEADLRLECFTTGASTDFHLVFRYHPATNRLSAKYSNGKVVIWRRPGHPPPPPPTLDLRVNYGHDWVESFYEAGHMAWITVTESDGVTVKATAELVTEPKDFWGGETGFQTRPEDWHPAPPDIQPYDWVYGWLDNGASAQVQIGDISGMIDLGADSIQGTINAPWFTSDVQVECHPWGAPDPQPEMKFDAVQPDGTEPYSCSWAGEWDIQPEQDVGVGYFGPDGHWVANAFRVPNPRFTAFPAQEYIEGWEWPLGAVVHLTIDDPGTDDSPDFWQDETVVPTPWDPNGSWVQFNFAGLYDMKPGDIVTLTEGTTIREHTVRALAVTAVDKDANTVSGTAVPGVLVYVWPHEFGEYEQQLTTGEDGTWLADFASLGFDLLEGMAGRSEIRDDVGNATAVDWWIPSPRFTAFPEQEYIEGWDWPLDVTVHLAIDDPATEISPDYEQDEPVVPTPWDPNSAWATFNFVGLYDMKPGDVVTLNEGETIRAHTVQNLGITALDAEADTVAGTADADAEIYVWPHATGEQVLAMAGSAGAWQVDFTDIFDLVPREGGRAEIRDEAGNATAVDWQIPDPRFTVFPEWEYVEGWDWLDGATVTAAIEGKPECSVEGMAGYPEWDPWTTFVSMNFPEACDVVAGDVVTLTDGATMRTHTVRDLAIAALDIAADTISGTADAGAALHVWPHGFGEYEVQPAADADGAWLADFGAVGFDLQEGMCGRAEIRDEAGNTTAVDWCTPNPGLIAFPEADYIFGYGWPEGTEVNLAINDPPDFTQAATVGPAPWDPNDIMAYFEFAGLYDLKPGDVVTLSGSGMERHHTVRNLAVTEVNAATDTVAGLADEGALVHAWVHGFGELELQPTVGEDGTWLADFASLGLDLQEGMCGRAEIRDDLGNATAVDWCVPPPPRILVQISDDWFEGQNFSPNSQQTYEIYESDGGALLLSGTMQAGSQGTAFAWVGDQVDLVPGNYLVIFDGITTKELVLEALTFDLFDLSQGLLQGTAPPPEGRLVWVGIGFADDGWSMEVFTDPQGNWVADFGAPVAPDYEWVAAQVFDEDGDASEVRPSQIIEGQP